MDAIAVPSLGHHIKHCFSLDANDSPTVRSRHRSATPRTGALLGDVYMLDDLFFVFLSTILLVTTVGAWHSENERGMKGLGRLEMPVRGKDLCRNSNVILL